MRWNRALYSLACLAVTGCASIDGEGSLQKVLVQSKPPGASIFVDGKRVGRTPQYVDIRRGFHPEFELETAEGRRRVQLASTYRWSRSFLGGFAFLQFVPIAWTVDLFTGTAWEAQPGKTEELTLSKADSLAPAVDPNYKTIAIAPPNASSRGVSEVAAKILEASLEQRSDRGLRSMVVRPYRDTTKLFFENDWDFDTAPSDRSRLTRDLHVDQIVESDVVVKGDRFEVQARIFDVAKQTTTADSKLEIGKIDGLDRLSDGSRWWSRLIPNTVGIDFVSEKLEFETATGKKYQLSPVEGDEWWSKGLRYLSAVNISNTSSRRGSRAWRWEFSAVPAFRISHRRARATDFPLPAGGTAEDADPVFTRWSVLGGYGAEVGYQFGRSLFYGNLIPLLQWNEIRWRQTGGEHSITETDIAFQLEVGYSYLFDSSWLVRAFSRTSGEAREAWMEAVGSRLGPGSEVKSIATISTGITLAYYFEPSIRASYPAESLAAARAR